MNRDRERSNEKTGEASDSLQELVDNPLPPPRSQPAGTESNSAGPGHAAARTSLNQQLLEILDHHIQLAQAPEAGGDGNLGRREGTTANVDRHEINDITTHHWRGQAPGPNAQVSQDTPYVSMLRRQRETANLSSQALAAPRNVSLRRGQAPPPYFPGVIRSTVTLGHGAMPAAALPEVQRRRRENVGYSFTLLRWLHDDSQLDNDLGHNGIYSDNAQLNAFANNRHEGHGHFEPTRPETVLGDLSGGLGRQNSSNSRLHGEQLHPGQGSIREDRAAIIPRVGHCGGRTSPEANNGTVEKRDKLLEPKKNGKGFQRPMTEKEKELAESTGMSKNYKGDPSAMRNFSVIWLPDELNTSFWILFLPPDVTHKEIFALIRNCGRVDVLHLNRERVEEFGKAAAKLVMMTTQGARNIWTLYGPGPNSRRITIRGFTAEVRRNRTRVPQHPDAACPVSRCLKATGPRLFVEETCLLNWLRRSTSIYFDLDEVVKHPNVDEDTTSLTIRFARYTGQADRVFEAFTTSFFTRWPSFQVSFDHDPCA